VTLDSLEFDPEAFLANAGLARRTVELRPKEAFFAQGDAADSVFYLQKGRAKVTVVSKAGKEATITLLVPRDFVGEEALATVPGLRLASATAMTACTALKIAREDRVHQSLLNVILHDQLPDRNAAKPDIPVPSPGRSKRTKSSRLLK
jgi:CRP/FNR family transcriptional regulator, cyclic AMP receptor protein